MKRKRGGPILLAGHKPDCYALKNSRTRFWGTPWAFLKEVEYRDTIGRRTKQGGTRWWRAGCNCIGCPAEVIVNETAILETLPDGSIDSALTVSAHQEK